MSHNIIILDFETGGLSPKKNPITQVALQSIKFENFEVISKYDNYVQPYNELVIEDKAREISGVTIQHTNLGITVQTLVKDLIKEFDKAKSGNKKPILCGHNIMFDIGFLQAAFKFCKEDLSKVLDCKDEAKLVPNYIDTLFLSQMKWANDPTINSFKLEKCCEQAQLEKFDAHNAINDVQATKELFEHLMKSMRNDITNDNKETIRFRDTFEF